MRKLYALVAVLGVAGATGLQAQDGLPVGVEARGGIAFPSGEWNEDGDPGTGFGVTAIIPVGGSQRFAIYGGWERYSFDLDEGGDPEGGEFDAANSGARLGVEFMLPLPRRIPVVPFVLGGATYSRLTLAARGGGASVEFESDRSLGFEIGGGIKVPLGAVLTMIPMIRYGSHPAEFEALSGLEAEEEIGRITFDLGLRLGF